MKKIQVFSTTEDERVRITRALTDAGFHTSAEASCGEARDKFRAFRPDAIIIVDSAPEVHALISRLRGISLVPFLVIGSSERHEAVNILESGADRYIMQPVSSLELVARVKAILRLYGKYYSNSVEPSIIDNRLQSTNSPDGLTNKEYCLLSSLFNKKGQIIPFNRLLIEVWSGKAGLQTLHYHARNLKKKLDGNEFCPYYLQSYRGQGYCLYDTATAKYMGG